MKNLIYIILGVIIGAVLTYYFCPREACNVPQMATNKVPKDTISVKEAKILSYNWEKNNPTEIDSMLEVEGSRKQMRSVSWSLEDINNYLVYAKAKSDSLGYDFKGLRVYLGNYGENSQPGKKNRNTMFIVPTGTKIISKASSINLNFRGSDEDIPAPPLNDGHGGNGGYPN